MNLPTFIECLYYWLTSSVVNVIRMSLVIASSFELSLRIFSNNLSNCVSFSLIWVSFRTRMNYKSMEAGEVEFNWLCTKQHCTWVTALAISFCVVSFRTTSRIVMVSFSCSFRVVKRRFNDSWCDWTAPMHVFFASSNFWRPTDARAFNLSNFWPNSSIFEACCCLNCCAMIFVLVSMVV